MGKMITSFEKNQMQKLLEQHTEGAQCCTSFSRNTAIRPRGTPCPISTLHLRQILLMPARDVILLVLSWLSSEISLWGSSHKTRFTAIKNACCNAVPPRYEKSFVELLDLKHWHSSSDIVMVSAVWVFHLSLPVLALYWHKRGGEEATLLKQESNVPVWFQSSQNSNPSAAPPKLQTCEKENQIALLCRTSEGVWEGGTWGGTKTNGTFQYLESTAMETCISSSVTQMVQFSHTGIPKYTQRWTSITQPQPWAARPHQWQPYTPKPSSQQCQLKSEQQIYS